MVGEREDIGAQIDPARHQRRLGPPLDVSRQQHAPSRQLDPHHQGAGVARRPAAARGGPQGCDHQIRESRGRVTGAAFENGHGPRPRRVEHRGEFGSVASTARQPDGPHVDRLQNGRQPAAVIRVGVRRQHQIQPLHAQRRQRGDHDAAAEIDTARDRKARIDQDRGATPLNQGRVTPPDIQGNHARRIGQQSRGGRERHHQAHRQGQRRAHKRSRRPEGEHHQRPGEGEPEGCGPDRRTEDGSLLGRPLDREEREGRNPLAPMQHPRRGRSRRCARRRRSREGRGQEHQRRPRNPDQVGNQTQGRRGAEVIGGERGGGGHGARRGAQPPGDGGSQARASVVRGLPGWARGHCERSARHKGELGAGLEERLRLDGQDRHCGRGQRLHAHARAPARDGRGQAEQQHQGATDGDTPAGRQRVEDRPRDARRQRQLPGVAARREPRAAAQKPARPREDQGRHQSQVQSRYREQVGEPEAGEGIARLLRQVAAIPECEGAEQPAAGPGLREPLRQRGPPAVQAGQGPKPLSIRQAHVKRGVHQPAHGPDPLPLQAACPRPRAGISQLVMRAQPHAREDALPGERRLQCGRLRWRRPVENANAPGQPRRAALRRGDLREVDAHPPLAARSLVHGPLERDLQGRARSPTGSGLELPAQGERARRDRRHPREPGARRRPPGDGRAERDRRRTGDQRGIDGQESAVGEQDAERLCRSEDGEQSPQEGHRGTGESRVYQTLDGDARRSARGQSWELGDRELGQDTSG